MAVTARDGIVDALPSDGDTVAGTFSLAINLRTSMGYASLTQTGKGLHTRLYGRCFIIGDEMNRVLFIHLDIGLVPRLIRKKVLAQLGQNYSQIYRDDNVVLTGTHTHSGPGGLFEYFFYQLLTGGLVSDSVDLVVSGIVKCAQMAHENVQQGYITMSMGNLTDASINRSPTAYLNNPASERARYDADVDHQMVLLNLKDKNGNSIGLINWFAVHTTSVNNTNHLVSSDNKGIAELLFEQQMDPSSLPGQSKFVAAFANSNFGDVSPNTKGPLCQDTGLPCDSETSTCNGSPTQCYALGPGKDMFESTLIIGKKQYEKALELYHAVGTPISGPVKSIHQFMNIASTTLEDGNTTCTPAMGYSYAGGTIDGPGLFIFKQGITTTNSPVWDKLIFLPPIPQPGLVECQKPKQILVQGNFPVPYEWFPRIVDTQIFQIGNVVIVISPSELTTMAGRRLREAIKQVYKENGFDVEVIVNGLSNIYTSYVATYEEYQVQRYEGGSTLYGPHTLQAYIEQFEKLAKALIENSSVPPGPTPPTLLSESLILPTLYDILQLDIPPLGKQFGQVIQDAGASYTKGSTVVVTFHAVAPRKYQKLVQTFLRVEHNNGGTWELVATDANWETKFHWIPAFTNSTYGSVMVEWDVGQDTPPGDYRIIHSGYQTIKLLIVTFSKTYTGTSRVFTVQ